MTIEELELELEWRDISGYEGLYKVSECGDVMSIRRGKKRLLKPRQNQYGYLRVMLYKDGVAKDHRIHRLVATEFCEGANESKEVNHIDKNRANNDRSNLEWVSHEYNIRYSLNRKVKCIELDMVFNSLNEAAEYTGIDYSNISNCCRGRRKTTGGYHWEYVD